MLRAMLESYRQAFRGLSRRAWLLALVTLIDRMGSMVGPFLALAGPSSVGGCTSTRGRTPCGAAAWRWVRYSKPATG
jgi:hypothetical protein